MMRSHLKIVDYILVKIPVLPRPGTGADFQRKTHPLLPMIRNRLKPSFIKTIVNRLRVSEMGRVLDF
jgi:hypothetical protein